MEVAMNKCRKECEDEQMKRKKNEVHWFAFLADDVVLDILKRFPYVFLRYNAKYVCRKWFNIINMILSDNSFFILQKSFGFTVRYVDVREEGQGLEVKEQNLYFFGRIKSWYNEFLLITNPTRKRNSLYIYNIITKEKSFLPKCPTFFAHQDTSVCAMALFFDRLKGVYKVVHLFMGLSIQCYILQLEKGIVVSRVSSRWKKIKVPFYLHPRDVGELVSIQVQGRYFHWNVNCSKYLVSVDMIKEEVLQMSLPEPGERKRLYYSIFEMGGFLSLIDGVSWDKTDLWILKDFQSMKWEKLHSITVPDHGFVSASFRYPVCGVINKRYIVFMRSRHNKSLFSYDLKNRVLKKLNIRIDLGDLCVAHSSGPSGKTIREDVPVSF
ncbi:unnamed protein product [Lactuca virosa]|uniref:F-box associated beta-propeller type 3 domain-containing protein n=1 Tax=Lactuca virosa TaxID=75947 RepID=A0AAU9M6M8_9ASTR|nr:unnamed protein product [Lactuca virosa]